MADCTKVILLFDDNTTRVYDPKDIDSIFFDDDLAKCFRDNCLGGSSGSVDPEKTLEGAIKRRNQVKSGGGGAGGGAGGGSAGGGGNPGDPTQEATLTSTAVATAEPITVASSFEPCIHMRDCTWDCGTT